MNRRCGTIMARMWHGRVNVWVKTSVRTPQHTHARASANYFRDHSPKLANPKASAADRITTNENQTQKETYLATVVTSATYRPGSTINPVDEIIVDVVSNCSDVMQCVEWKRHIERQCSSVVGWQSTNQCAFTYQQKWTRHWHNSWQRLHHELQQWTRWYQTHTSQLSVWNCSTSA